MRKGSWIILFFVVSFLFCLSGDKTAFAEDDKWMVNKKTAVELNADALNFFKSGQWTRALDNFGRALNKEPDNIAIRYNMALVQYKLRRYVISKKECITILKERPRHKDALSLYLASIKGIRDTPGGADPELMGDIPDFVEGGQTNSGGRIPEEVEEILAASYKHHDFNFVWENLAADVKALIPKSVYVKSSNLNYQNEMKSSRVQDMKVLSFDKQGKYGVAFFEVLFENSSTPEMKEVLGGDPSYVVRVRNYMFFLKENARWKMHPDTVFDQNLTELFSRFDSVFKSTSNEIKYKGMWFDKNYFFLDRFEKLWRRREPERSTNARVLKVAYDYLFQIKNGHFDKAWEHLSTFSRNMLTERKMKTLSPYRNIVQIETYNVQAGQKIASCDFKIENLNVDHNQGSLNLTRLESSVWLTYEDASWKIVDYTHRYRFYDRKKGEMVDMKFREDQFAHFNGRDWIDNSAEYRKRMKNELGRK